MLAFLHWDFLVSKILCIKMLSNWVVISVGTTVMRAYHLLIVDYVLLSTYFLLSYSPNPITSCCDPHLTEEESEARRSDLSASKFSGASVRALESNPAPQCSKGDGANSHTAPPNNQALRSYSFRVDVTFENAFTIDSLSLVRQKLLPGFGV